MTARAVLANRNPPILHSFDRYGNRRDEVEFHPAWHELMTVAVGQGLHSAPWADPRPGAHLARGASVYLMCTGRGRRAMPGHHDLWLGSSVEAASRTSRRGGCRGFIPAAYDGRFGPARDKTGALIGMGMTEKQGGSDLRANTTRAEPVGAPVPDGLIG